MNRVNSINYPFSFSFVKGKWFGVKIHLVSVIILIIIAWLSDDQALILISGGLISFFAYLYIALLEAKRTPAFLGPLSFYFFWYSVGLGLAAVYYGTVIINAERISFSTATVNYSSLVPAYLIYLVGSLSLHIGLQLFRPKSEEKKSKSSHYSLKTIIVLASAGILYEMFFEYFSIIGGLINFLRFGLLAAVSLLAITSPKHFRLSKGFHLILILAGCAGLFLMNISTTSKSLMMFSFFPLIWYLILDRKKWKYLFFLVLLLIPFYFFIIYPASYEMRSQYWSGEGINKTKAFSKALSERETIKSGMEGNPFTAYLERTFDPIAVAYIYQQVDLYGYVSGETMEYASYAFIPRIFWPDKPVVTQGAWFAYYTGFASSPEKSSVSIGITAIGELFWNFGIAGVAVGMFFIGALISGLWRMAGNDPRRSVISMLLYINLLFFLTGMSEAVTVLTGIVILFIVFKILFTLRALLFKVR